MFNFLKRSHIASQAAQAASVVGGKAAASSYNNIISNNANAFAKLASQQAAEVGNLGRHFDDIDAITQRFNKQANEYLMQHQKMMK